MNAVTAAAPPTAPRTAEPAILVSGLVKTFGRTRALDGLDLRVATGEVHGFLGPNGAGKSTTLRILLGLLRADTGTARLLGSDPWADAVALHRRLAYVPGDVELWPNLTGGEAIDLLARLRSGHSGARGGVDPRRRDELIERFGLDPTKKGRTYSKGNRQKVAIIAALASDAELLLLDEPTAGLDPLMEVVFQDVVLQAKEAGRTVLLSSHILAQVEKLCDRVSIIRLGRTVQSGSLGELRHLTRTTIEAETDGPLTGLAELPGVHGLRTEGGRVHFAVDGAHLDEAVRRLGTLGVRSLVSHPPTLEELMLRHYGDELPELAGLSGTGEDAAPAARGPAARGPVAQGPVAHGEASDGAAGDGTSADGSTARGDERGRA
ncbi:ATP-binding cassette domain-containing protein [Streptomyces cacaoi]|uniref:ABC transporter ATP-binding protein n=1 Tax=Streptomyces cacaoi TaxID=1898 RepID=A0A4Y3R2S6_STRCI|nr:ABC transporter ATP-binding protein [Streptomyces cacaoi]NNG89312.1 ABC transporter ATP-binding protein [Streptomyces cacaoi]GEB51891.1 ABC transporter ATP-binding protein [Streptomyces cacaoi]